MVFDAFLRFRIRSRADNDSKHHQEASEPLGEEQQQQREKHPKPLLTLPDLPSWRDPNPYILSGYRPPSNSYTTSLASFTYWHNETCNIYTHLIPGVLILFAQGVLYEYVRNRHTNLEQFDRSILKLQLYTAAFCFLVSASYHTLVDHSAGVARRWLQLDYVGIMVLILGNFVSGLHFGFYCSPLLKGLYWGLITLLSITTGTLLLIPKFRGPEYRSFRLGSFIATGLSAFAPIGHASMLWGLGYTARIGVPYYLLEGAFLVIGCYIWERRMPERLWPGKFDFCGHSHTLWHVFVALSVGAHVWGLVRALDYVYEYEWCRVGV